MDFLLFPIYGLLMGLGLVALRRSSAMNYFIHTSRHFTTHGRHELNKLTSLPMCGFIAQLAEHRTGIAEVMGLNPVEALIFFQASPFDCSNWKINCDVHSSLSTSDCVINHLKSIFEEHVIPEHF